MDQHTKNNLAIVSSVTSFARKIGFRNVRTYFDIPIKNHPNLFIITGYGYNVVNQCNLPLRMTTKTVLNAVIKIIMSNSMR